MPKDVRDMLKKAGLKRKDLLNKDLAIKIFSIIEEGTEIENLTNHHQSMSTLFNHSDQTQP